MLAPADALANKETMPPPQINPLFEGVADGLLLTVTVVVCTVPIEQPGPAPVAVTE